MWLIDGSNVLGAIGADLTSADAKRELARLVASFARARRTRVTCFFDGPEPPSFARHLGAATIVFCGSVSADERIVEQVGTVRDATVVTADRALATRVAGRRVKVVSSSDFVRELERAGQGGEGSRADDWAMWLADPKNRQKF